MKSIMKIQNDILF